MVIRRAFPDLVTGYKVVADAFVVRERKMKCTIARVRCQRQTTKTEQSQNGMPQIHVP
jgi:hypothetical protein